MQLLDASDDPIVLFRHWLAAAERSELNDPNAMCLATCTPDGRPSARMVLLKGLDENGFVFYTNGMSRKAHEIRENPHAALCFHWKSLRRQVRIEGVVTPVSDADADEYFASRSRKSQLGAWASDQSAVLPERALLEQRLDAVTNQYEGVNVPRPPHWYGNRVVPARIEFWQDMPHRLHDRLVYEKVGTNWKTYKLYP